jgi:ABC-2 type transport system permease protein
MPILIFAAFLPTPYGIGLPANIVAGVGFLITAILGFLVVIAYSMLIYIATFYTYTPTGVRMVSISLVEFLGGAVIPLPFLPEGIRKVVELLPFASMQNIPLRIYSGDITGMEMIAKASLQLFWIIALVWIGKRLIGAALKRVVVQGG